MGITIAVDAMGGDRAPETIVHGALMAAGLLEDTSLILVGDESRIRAVAAGLPAALRRSSTDNPLPDNLQIVHTDECIGMDDPPRHVMRKMRNCSIALATRLVAEGRAQALFSAGNSGACMAAAIHQLHTLEGIDRPAIATLLPGIDGPGRVLLLDAGGNTDCDEHNLVEFAIMGSAYASKVMGIATPRVGLINIGEEEGKGNSLTKNVSALLKRMPLHFVGNVEGNHIFHDRADVLVCDGFVGNVILKNSEGTVEFLQNSIKRASGFSPLTILGALLMKPAFRRVRQWVDYAEVGGAPLLGVRGACVIGHGRSNETAVMNGIRHAAHTARHDPSPEILRLIGQSRLVIADSIAAS